MPEEAAETSPQVHPDHGHILQPRAELVLVRRLIGEIGNKGSRDCLNPIGRVLLGWVLRCVSFVLPQ